MKRLIIAAVLLACWSSSAAAKTACLPSHGTDAYYQYRVIDGRKCWYRGAERLEKSALYWKSENRRPVTRTSAVIAGESPALSSVVKDQAALESPQVAATSLTSGSGEPAPDFDSVFAHFPAYEVARPVVHLLFPKNVAQAWGSKRVAVVVYRRPE